jgi:hypothetical protein
MSGLAASFIFLDGPAGNFNSAVCETRCGEFWSRHGIPSENRTIRVAAETPRACGRCRRFDFQAGFRAVFYLTLQHLLDYIFNFRDDTSGAAAARGLTTWHFNHRAGQARRNREGPATFLR